MEALPAPRGVNLAARSLARASRRTACSAADSDRDADSEADAEPDSDGEADSDTEADSEWDSVAPAVAREVDAIQVGRRDVGTSTRTSKAMPVASDRRQLY